MEGTLISCDECNKPFNLQVKERNHPGKITEAYIQCPHCESEFISYVVDEHVRREQQEIKKLHERYIKRKANLSGYMAKLKADIIDKRGASV